MPRKEMIRDEYNRVKDWRDTQEVDYFTTVPGLHTGTYTIAGEPFILWEDEALGRRRRYFLVCSDKHARQIEEAGVLSFFEKLE